MAETKTDAPKLAVTIDASVVKKELDDAARMIVKLQAHATELRIALQTILAEPYGCPACDSGKLRGPKPHWDDCGYAKAQTALAVNE